MLANNTAKKVAVGTGAAVGGAVGIAGILALGVAVQAGIVGLCI